MKMRSHMTLLGAGLCALAMPAHAQDAGRDPVQAKVKLNDLNLNTAAGHRTARDRIEGAARTACGSGNGSPADANDAARCKAEVKTSGAVGVAYEESRQRQAERARYARPVRYTRTVRHARYRHCYWSKRTHKRVCVWRRR